MLFELSNGDKEIRTPDPLLARQVLSSQEITIHKAAKQAFDELQITKLPSMQSLYEEFHQLAVQKKQDRKSVV